MHYITSLIEAGEYETIVLIEAGSLIEGKLWGTQHA